MSYGQPSSVTLCIPSPLRDQLAQKDRQTKFGGAGSRSASRACKQNSLASAYHKFFLRLPLDAVRAAPADSRSADNGVMAPDLLRNVDIGVVAGVV